MSRGFALNGGGNTLVQSPLRSCFGVVAGGPALEKRISGPPAFHVYRATTAEALAASASPSRDDRPAGTSSSTNEKNAKSCSLA